jgi:hypothetical protein
VPDSDILRAFGSAGQLRRRSTVEIISAAMCLTVRALTSAPVGHLATADRRLFANPRFGGKPPNRIEPMDLIDRSALQMRRVLAVA